MKSKLFSLVWIVSLTILCIFTLFSCTDQNNIPEHESVSSATPMESLTQHEVSPEQTAEGTYTQQTGENHAEPATHPVTEESAPLPETEVMTEEDDTTPGLHLKYRVRIKDENKVALMYTSHCPFPLKQGDDFLFAWTLVGQDTPMADCTLVFRHHEDTSCLLTPIDPFASELPEFRYSWFIELENYGTMWLDIPLDAKPGVYDAIVRCGEETILVQESMLTVDKRDNVQLTGCLIGPDTFLYVDAVDGDYVSIRLFVTAENGNIVSCAWNPCTMLGATTQVYFHKKGTEGNGLLLENYIIDIDPIATSSTADMRSFDYNCACLYLGRNHDTHDFDDFKPEDYEVIVIWKDLRCVIDLAISE